jgi:hypothetical protein
MKEQNTGVEIILKGNVITQKFYTEKILPQYIEQIKALEAHYKRRFWLQEDSNPSHSNQSTNNPYTQLKRDADL